jgi:hypothetical protein
LARNGVTRTGERARRAWEWREKAEEHSSFEPYVLPYSKKIGAEGANANDVTMFAHLIAKLFKVLEATPEIGERVREPGQKTLRYSA